MSKPIPKNLQIKLAILYQKYRYSTFSFEDACELLGVNKSYLGKILSELCNKGWVTRKRTTSDNRRKIYSINEFSETFFKLTSENDGQ